MVLELPTAHTKRFSDSCIWNFKSQIYFCSRSYSLITNFYPVYLIVSANETRFVVNIQYLAVMSGRFCNSLWIILTKLSLNRGNLMERSTQIIKILYICIPTLFLLQNLFVIFGVPLLIYFQNITISSAILLSSI